MRPLIGGLELTRERASGTPSRSEGPIALVLRGTALLCLFGVLAATVSCRSHPTARTARKIVFVAGKPSHGPAQHEHRAGCLLLKSCLDNVPGITSVVYSNGWPDDPHAFDGVASIVLYADGGPGHPALQDDHLQILGALMKKVV